MLNNYIHQYFEPVSVIALIEYAILNLIYMARDVHQGNDTFSPPYEFTHCDNYKNQE